VAGPLEQRAHEPHLLEHRRQVLGGGLDRLLAELAQALEQRPAVAAAPRRDVRRERAQRGGEQRLLLGDDRALGA
jgi:hypothetical protein